VAVSSDGVVHEYNFKGEQLNDKKPIGFEGYADWCGWIDYPYNLLYVTAWTQSQNDKEYHDSLYLIDISNDLPKIKAKYSIIKPERIVPMETFGQITILGETNTQCIMLPNSF
jgi:hypothetical protein